MRTLGLVVVLALAPCAAAAEWPQIALEERFAGFERPVQLIHAGDGSGRLFIADVGQNSYEEVNVQPAASRGGENYGWRLMEGSHCFNPDPCDPTGLVLPVVEYDHSSGRLYAVTDIDRLSRDPTIIPLQPAR